MSDLVMRAQGVVLPSRSRYQLRNFCIGQHDTKPMQYRQVLIEAQQLAYNIAMAECDIRKKQIEILRLEKSTDELDLIEAEEKRLGITITSHVLAGARLELQWLQEMVQEIGEFTTLQIEDDQPEYWRLRLSRQASLEQMSTQQGIGPGNLQSMLNAGLLQKESDKCGILPGA
jgi:hypothetical protein